MCNSRKKNSKNANKMYFNFCNMHTRHRIHISSTFISTLKNGKKCHFGGSSEPLCAKKFQNLWSKHYDFPKLHFIRILMQYQCGLFLFIFWCVIWNLFYFPGGNIPGHSLCSATCRIIEIHATRHADTMEGNSVRNSVRSGLPSTFARNPQRNGRPT